MTIKRIGVLGAGTMGGGSGITHLAAARGFEVILYSEEQRFLDDAIKRISGLIDRKIGKQKMTVEEKEAILKRITTTTNIEDFAPVDLVIEAIFDDIEIRKSAIRKLDKICRAEIIFCSNTSNMSFTALASATSRPDKVVGLNFLNPPPIMRYIEVIRGPLTSEETVVLATEVVQAMGKIRYKHKVVNSLFAVNPLRVT
jgi:3-hydroxybutyryl-CoA dehydrogenase